MNLFHITSELRRFGHGKLPPLAIAVITMLPLLFGGLFVWSYWDPIGHINKLPVAVVNSDEGTKVGDKEVNAGKEIADTLVREQQAKFILVDPEEAKQGIEDGTYYFGIEFPSDFSEAATSAVSDNPHQAKLNAVYNNNNGFLATMLGKQVVGHVLSSVNENLGSEVASNLLVGFNTVGEGMDQAAEGAGKIAEGTKQARDGSGKLADGSSQLKGGTDELGAGANKLADGASRLDAGIGQASQGADQLASGLNQLNAATDMLGNGAGQVSDGVNKVVGLAGQAADAQQATLAPLVNLAASLRATGIPQAIDLANQADQIVADLSTQGVGPNSPIIGQLAKLSKGAEEIHRQLSDPNADYRAGINKATSGAGELATGLHQLKDGSSQLVVGTRTLADGTSKLSEGATQLTVGASQLQSGLVQLDEGSNELALKISEGATKVPRTDESKLDDASRNVAAPATTVDIKDQLPLFGEGLAPMFAALGLFMGGTITFMVMRPLQRRAIESGMNAFRVVVASYVPVVFVGVAQASIMFFVQRQFIGLHAVHEFGLLMAMIYSSLVFMAIVQAFNAVFGTTVGRVVSLCFMSLQIVSSGGLYPPETQPAPLRWFHPFDPMTYSVNLFRHAIFGVDSPADPRVLQAFLVLLLFAVISFVCSCLAAMRERQMKLKDLHPEVSV